MDKITAFASRYGMVGLSLLVEKLIEDDMTPQQRDRIVAQLRVCLSELEGSIKQIQESRIDIVE